MSDSRWLGNADEVADQAHLFPAAAVALPPLLKAAGVIHVVPKLAVLPGEWEDGVFYPVHDDRGVAAFPWTDIAEALSLESCAVESA